MTDPIRIDDISETDVYVATLELRSVGSSKTMFPALRWSHMFTQEPTQVPASYLAIMQIAEKIGAVFAEDDAGVELPDGLADADEVARYLAEALKKEQDE